MYSNFITPPDFIEDDNHSVLLVDPSEADVVEISLLCKQVGTDFNVYIYLEQYDDLKWLEEGFNRSDAVCINTQPNEISKVKDQLVEHFKSHHYGPKRFLDINRRMDNPIEYFINYVKIKSTSTFTDL
jgi:hypothetical protein|tara:strand:+ start:71 stop:454 length:384 start_codon:yes stop_codon:yes gene_type:complete